MSAFLSLDINSITFTITKAHIRESLQSPFHITCNGFIESFYADIFSATFASLGKTNSPSHTIQSHTQDTDFASSAPPYSFALDQPFNLQLLQDNFALLYISNPYGNTNYHSALSISLGNTSTPIKSYKGIITHIEYLGSKSNVSLDTNNTINTIADITNTSQQKTLSSLDIPTPKSINHRHFFTFTLTSPLIRLSLNKANRIYTDKTPLDILKDILTAYTPQLCKQIDFSSLSQIDNPLEIITQYEESDLDFITRLAHNNGIYFYEDNDTLYVCHHTPYTPIPLTKVPFNPNVKTHNNLNEPCIFALTHSHHIHTKQFNFFSNDANNPQINTYMYSKYIDKQSPDIATHSASNDTSLAQEDMNNPYNYTASMQSVFIPNVSFTYQANIKSLCSNQAQHTANTQALMNAQSNIYTLCLAQRLYIESKNKSLLGNNIQDNKTQESINEYTIIALEQTLINESILADTLPSHQQANDSNISRFKDAYSNLITLLPSNLSYMPTPKPKPNPPSLMQGIVVGEEYIKAKNIKEANASIIKQSNTLYTDNFGRVKVRLHAFMAQALLTDNDIHTTPNTNNTHLEDDLYTLNTHTAFLRVASPIASNHSGFYHTPRVGDEVLISYLNNDIDMPIIIGSLYNPSNPALPSLPLASHQTSLSARTLNNSSALQAENTNSHHNLIESGFNEITLSNLKEQEHIYLQAQRDYEELIKHNFTQTIHNNKESQVEGTYNERIKKIHTQTIDLAKIVSIGGEYNTNVALSKDTIVGLSHTLNVGASNKLRVAKKSSEYVGEDKEVEIGGNVKEEIEGDKHQKIKGEVQTHIEKSLMQNVEGDVDINTTQNYTLVSNEKTILKSSKAMSLTTNENLSLEADSSNSEIQTNYSVNAGNTIIHQVGDTSITAKGDSVIIKAGGVEVVIDSKGLVVKGGEVKAE
ncbi:type VI secretion system Vgr family protein [uncultured Helicobacter sp.]|uniref:type VI secretion system Vgr family protein n=2 Tax=uncultured Helicobacter sp. TaxID=175537 RepID=UPI002607447F|nr:contractile injection system protein, VgrG/Pvc8 family [uncultured Helicobacter sp.]